VTTSVRSNPFVGIRPFFDEDSIFFFGRREQTKDLLAALGESRFLTVLGSSGSGKSSLVRSGLIPTLQAGFLVGSRTGWRMAKCRPGDAPIENIGEALLRAAGKPRTPEAIHAFAETLREGHLDAALELLQPVVAPDENVLVLVDQFEELFAFRTGAAADIGDEAQRNAERIRRRGDAANLVSLLLGLAAQTDVPVYIVLTMRTDFLGDADLFAGLPEAINRSGYLVPRLTRAQLREAIEGPARLMGARVEPRLVDRLVNDVGDRGDRLPLLQHALHRAWESWDAEGRIGPLDLTHFERIGGLDHALDQEGEEVIGGTPLAVAERVFKRLTDTDPQQRRVRRPARRSELLAVAGADAAVVDALLERCAKEGTNFVFASDDGVAGDPRYSIAHESLIRQWDRLRRWVDDEQALRDWYLGLAREVAAWRADRALPLLSPQATRVALDTMRTHTPTAAWAARYTEAASTFQEVTAFITESRESNERARRQRTTLLASLAGVLVISAALVTWSGFRAREALASAEATGFTSAIERLVDEDPTYAAALASEFDTTDAWNGARKELLLRVLGQPTARAEFHDVATLALSREGDRVALLRRSGIVEVRAADGSGVADTVVRAPGEQFVAIDSSGNVWTAGPGRRDVALWSAATRISTRIPVSPGRGLSRIAMSEGGRWIFVVDSVGGIYATRTASPSFRQIGQDDASGVQIYTHQFREELVFVADRSGRVDLINAEAGKRLTSLPAGKDETGEPLAITVSADGRSVLLSRNSGKPDLYRLSADLTRVVTRDRWAGRELSSAALSPDGALVVAAFTSGRVSLHRGLRTEALWTRDTPEEYPQVAFNTDGEWIVVTSPYGTVRLMHRDDASADIVLRGHRATTAPATIAYNGRRLATNDADGIARVWEPWRRAGQHGLPVRWPKGTELTLSPDGTRLIASTRDGEVSVYPLDSTDVVAARRVIRVPADTQATAVLAVSKRGDAAVLTSPRLGVAVWRVGGGLQPLNLSYRDVWGAALTPDAATVVVASGDSMALAIDLSATQARTRVFRGQQLQSAKLSADGRSLIYTDGGALLRGDVQSGRVDTLNASTAFNGDQPVIASSATARYTVLGFDDRVGVVHHDGTSVGFLYGTSIAAFSDSGGWLASGVRGLELWAHRMPFDSTGQSSQRLTGFRQLVSHIGFNADETKLLTTGEYGEVRLWALGDTVKPELTLQHLPRLSYSEYEVYAASVVTPQNAEIRSVVQAPDQQPRIRYWPLIAGAIHRDLRSATSACLPFDVRRRVLGFELEDDALERVDRCTARAREPRPTPR
jgi:WD40 repeat protein